MASEKPKSSKASKTPKDGDKVHKLSLKGSAKLVAEFFEYSIHTILYQRGVYPTEDFTVVKKYGLSMLGILADKFKVSADDQVKAYIKKMMSQLNKWTLGGKVSKLVVVITSKDTGENLERWQFDVQLMGKAAKAKATAGAVGKENPSSNTEVAPPPKEKTEKEIQEEIRSLFRQITASVTFLPMLDSRCTFNVLVYADGDAEVPMDWGDSDAKEIQGGEKVTLRSWGTANHRVDTLVSYKLQD